MFEIIVVPLDGSELSEAALPAAQELKSRFNAKLIVLRALEPESHRLAQPAAFYESPAAAVANVELIEEAMEAERKEATAYLEAIGVKLGKEDVELVLIEESAGEAIVRIAAERNAGLIVMSSHGRGGLGRLVFGSVADHVLHNSPVPVLLIRLREEDKK